MGNPPLPQRIAGATLVVVSVVALALALWKLSAVVLISFGAMLIAIFLRTLAGWVTRWTGLSAGWALLTAVVVPAASVGAGLYFGGQALATQLTELSERLPKSLDTLRDNVSRYEGGRWLLGRLPTSSEEAPFSPSEMASYAGGVLSSASGAVGAAVVVLFLSLYWAYRPQPYVAGAIRLLPLGKRARVREVLGEVHETLKGWLLGKVVSMALVGVATSAGLSMIGVEPALALGGIAAILTFIPNLGPVIAAIPAVLLAFVESPTTALYVVALYLGIQTVESYLISPLIQKEAADLPPALTILAQVAMGILFGLPGVVLATPVLAAVIVLVTKLYIEDVLEAHSG